MNDSNLESITEILRKIPLFSELNANQHAEIIKRIVLNYYPGGYMIFNEGEPGDALFIIKQGRVRIYHEAAIPSEEKELKILGVNDFFGEMSLIEEKPRNAKAKTLEETALFKLSKYDFMQLISENPGMASIINEAFLHR
jgi:cAMP-binding proteins - catabolite gene activator and regulatory subunit of cAMP-dependent protein kinases